MDKNTVLVRKKGGRAFKYDQTFMRQVVSDYLTSEEGWGTVAKRFNVTSHQVRHWVSKFSSDIVSPTLLEEEVMSPEEKKELDAIIKKNQELQKQLQQANMQIVGLQTLIDVAEDMLKIDIRKKPGSKQSKK